ncbi:hypothetical protein H6F89_31335 [Cyanobacteria bacterium FACHB-63]|nr:hypothetical protein [Cyanobacteria bacterium FACHB-63]
MGFKVKPKHFKQTWKVGCKVAPVAIVAAEMAFPQVKAVKVVTTAAKVLL